MKGGKNQWGQQYTDSNGDKYPLIVDKKALMKVMKRKMSHLTNAQLIVHMIEGYGQEQMEQME